MHTVYEMKGVPPYIGWMVACDLVRVGVRVNIIEIIRQTFSRISGKVPSDFGLQIIGFIVGRIILNIVPGL